MCIRKSVARMFFLTLEELGLHRERKLHAKASQRSRKVGVEWMEKMDQASTRNPPPPPKKVIQNSMESQKDGVEPWSKN